MLLYTGEGGGSKIVIFLNMAYLTYLKVCTVSFLLLKVRNFPLHNSMANALTWRCSQDFLKFQKEEKNCRDTKNSKVWNFSYGSEFSNQPYLKGFLCSLTTICLLKVAATYSTYLLILQSFLSTYIGTLALIRLTVAWVQNITKMLHLLWITDCRSLNIL